MTIFSPTTVAVSDLIVSLSFIIVSFTLYILSKNSKVAFKSLFLALSLLIAAYTATHMIDVILSWRPIYWLYLVKKLITLFTAVGMTLLFFKIKPQTEKAIRAVFDLETLIKESEEKLRIIFEGAQIGSWEWDLKDRVIWNKQNEKLFGYKPGSPLRTFKDFTDRIHPDDLNALINDSTNAIVGKTYYQREYRVIWPDKSIHWMLSIGQLICNEKNEPLKMTGITIETTHLKNTQEELMHNQEQVSLATEIAKIGTWEADAKTNLYRWSQKTAEIFDLGSTSALKEPHSFFESVHEEDKVAVHKAINQTFGSREDSFLRFRIVRPDKTVRWISARARPFFDSTGRLVKFLGTVRDITEEKKYEEVLSNQRKWLELVLNQMPIPFVMIEPSTANITFSNQSSNNFFKGKFLNSEIFEATDSKGNKINQDMLPGIRATQGEKINNLEINLNTPTGVRTMLVNSSILEAQYGQPATIIMPYQDITESKKTEKALEHALGLRDEFISVASHELKTPLTSLKLQLEMTKRQIDPPINKMPVPDKLNKVFETSIRQVNRISSLIEDLLDVSRIRAGKINYVLKETDVKDLINKSIERMLTQIKKANCKLKVDIKDPVFAIWDAARIEQIITNLISNATKYAPNSVISIKVEKRDSFIVIFVSDTGPGIPADLHEIIFNRFERGCPQHNITGLGIGLYIAKEIAKGHKGNLHLESELNKGSKFIVEIPVDPRESTA